MLNRMRSCPYLVIAGVLLLVAASRIYRLDTQEMNPDEVWSVWQTLGTPEEIVRWTPYDWPPLYYLTLGAWRSLAGMHPITLRMLSTLVFVVGTAVLYRLMSRIINPRTGVLAALAYGALGYSILLSIEVRGYGLLLVLMPVALWLTIEYFEKPSAWRALALALSLTLMFYTSLTSVIAFLMLGLYTLVMYPRKVWLWWLPGVLAAVPSIPEVLAKAQLARDRTEATAASVQPPLVDGLYHLFLDYAGDTFWLWVALFALATTIILYKRPRERHRLLLILALWVFAGPIMMYVLNSLLAFFSARYSWWVMVGIALWVGWGLAYLPRPGAVLVALVLVAMMFVPIPERYSIFGKLPPMMRNFQTFIHHARWGDTLLVDPQNRCAEPYGWDYYTRLYFPDSGLQFIHDVQGYRRIWYVTSNGWETPDLKETLTNGFLATIYFGPSHCLFQLYEAPPDLEGVLFENGMRFHGVDILDGDGIWNGPAVRREGETVRMRLWWSADGPITRDYSVGTYLLRSGNVLVAEVNGPPFVMKGPQETSRWREDEIYLEERELQLPPTISQGNLRLLMAVYYWEDGVRVEAPGVNDDTLLSLGQVSVKSW